MVKTYDGSRRMTRHHIMVVEYDEDISGAPAGSYVLVCQLDWGWKCYPIRKGSFLFAGYIKEKFGFNFYEDAEAFIEVLIEGFPEYGWVAK